MARTVLITGAGGFIGSHIVDTFRLAGWRPVALIRYHCPRSLQAQAADGNVRLVQGDAAVPDALVEDVRRILEPDESLDAVVHAAGRATDVGRRCHFERDNVASLRGVVSLCQALAVPRLVLISSTDVYGLRDFAGECEAELPLCRNAHNAYPASKIRAEELLAAALPPERWSILRPAAVWGPGDTTLMPRVVGFLRWSPWIVHFGPWRGRNRWPLAHVRNVATAARLAAVADEARGRAFNVLDPEFTTVDAFYRLVASVYLPGKTFRSLMLPRWLGLVFGTCVSTISNALDANQPITDPSHYAVRTVSSNLDFSNADLRAIFDGHAQPWVSRDQGVAELKATLLPPP